jgi:N-acetylglucosaminyldiphosphoundecaprenol N-acetyl-beta-D-mannosaminyltransferase
VIALSEFEKTDIPVIGIPLYSGQFSNAVDHAIKICVESGFGNNLRISTTGAHGMVISRKDMKFRNVLKSCYLNLPDGMPGVWVGRIKGAKMMERCYGPDFFKAVLSASAGHEVNHFFCGGKQGVADELKSVCEKTMGNHNIKGTFSPPFLPMSDRELSQLGKRINECNTDILWIGLSTPKQELFAERIAGFVNVGFIVTVGAAFDFYTGHVKQAPKWVQKNGIEWLFRLLCEPKRLWRRYGTIVPLFVWYNLQELLTGKFYSNSNITKEGVIIK